MLDRVLESLDVTAATGPVSARRDWPDVSPGYIGSPWPVSDAVLDFPQAAKLVPTVKAITDRIAHEIASIPPTFYRRQRNGKRVKIERDRKPGNIVDLVARGNAEQTGYEVLRDLQHSEDVNGNGYLFADRMGTKLVQELWSLHGHLMVAVAGPRRSVAHYEWGNGRTVRLAPEDVIPIRYGNVGYDPLEPAPIGLSPLEAARKQYETRFNMAEWQRMFYKRGANGALMIVVDEKASGASDAEIKKQQERFDKRFLGSANFGLPVWVRGARVERMGMTVAELELLETAGLCDADLCRIYGTVPEVFGFQVLGAARMDAKAAALHHDMVCLVPRWTLRDEVLNERLCPRFGDDVECKTDYWSRPALAEYRLEQAKSIVILTGGQPVLSPARGMELIGEEPSTDPEAQRIHWKREPVFGFGGAGIGEDGPAAPGEGAGKGADPTPAERTPERDREAQPAVASKVRAAAAAWTMDQRRRSAEANLRRYERRMERVARAILADWKVVALERLEREARMRGEVVGAAARVRAVLDPEDLDLDPDARALRRIQQLFADLILERGEAAAAEVGVEVALEAAAGRIAEWVRTKAGFLIRNMSETTVAAIRREMAAGLEANETFAEVIGRVRSYFDDQSQHRAALIARTETTGAYNYGGLLGYQEAGIHHKRWITIGDEVVRESHVACEAQGPIPMNQAFVNGLQYPGEVGGSADEVCNCRCVVEAEFEEAMPIESLFDRAPHRNGTVNRLERLFAVNGAGR